MRVLHVSPDSDLVIHIRLKALSARLKRDSLRRLQNLIQNNALVLVTSEIDEIHFREAGSSAQTRFKKLEAELEAIIRVGVVALSEKTLWQFIVPAAERCGMTPHGFNAALTRVMQAGMRTIAALPRWDKCGRIQSLQKGSSNPRPTHQPNSFSLSVDALSAIGNGAQKFKCGNASWHDAYTAFLEARYLEKIAIVNGEQLLIPKGRGERPSFGQFYRHGKAYLGKWKQLVLAHGEHAVHCNFRGKPNGQSANALLPGLEGEIDWTISDVVAVRRGNRLSIGRLVVYAIVDRFTGMILSIYLTLSTGRYEEAARAVMVCLEDKVELCGRYGRVIEKCDWNVRHIPWVIYSDKGEVDSWNSTSLATGLGVHLISAPGRRGDLKGGIESLMEQIRKLLRRLQGATSGFKERCQLSPHKTAIYDFDQLYRILLSLAVWRNKRIRSDQPFTKGMLAAGTLPTPNHTWQWALDSGLLREVPLEVARIHVLPHHEATVTEKGIRLFGLNFEVPNFESDRPHGIEANEWLASARASRWKVDLAVDGATVSHVWLRYRPRGRPPVLLKCPLSSRHATLKELAWEDYRLIREEVRTKIQGYRDKDLRHSQAEFRSVLRRTQHEAQELSIQARTGLTSKQLTQGIDQNRSDEKAAVSTLVVSPPLGPVLTFTPFFDPAIWGNS